MVTMQKCFGFRADGEGENEGDVNNECGGKFSWREEHSVRLTMEMGGRINNSGG
jgi:hypothetical protein